MANEAGSCRTSIIFVATPLGLMWLWASREGLCGVGYGDSVGRPFLARMARFGVASPEPVRTPLLGVARSQLLDYFNWRQDAFDLPLDLRGTDFQLQVWERLRATQGLSAKRAEAMVRTWVASALAGGP